MATFFLFGKYSVDALKGINAARTKRAQEIVKGQGGSIRSMHVLLGEKDLVIQADLPNTSAAMKASIELTKLTGIGFSTSEALTVEEFDKLA